MALPVYSYLVADLRTNAILDEVPLTGVKFNKPLNACGTFDATWQLSKSPSTTRRDPYDLTTPARNAIYALRDGRPMWGGIIWTSDYDSTTESVTIGAADWWSYFDHRRILPVLPMPVSTSYVAGLSVVKTAVEQNQIARDLLALAQSHVGGNILIESDTSTSVIPRDRTWFGFELATVGEELRRLSQVLNGPDMVFDVAASDTGRPKRLFRQGDPRLSQPGAPWVFEHGASVVSYRWPRNGARMNTRPFATGKGIDLGTPIAVAEDSAAYADRWPLLEGEGNYSSVESPSVLQQHADADLDITRRPVALPKFVVRSANDQRIDEIRQGDDVRIIVADAFHRNYDGPGRVVDIAFAVTEEDEKCTVTCSPLLEVA